MAKTNKGKAPNTTIYIDKEEAIQKALKTLTTAEHYEISGYYKPELVPEALKQIDKVASKSEVVSRLQETAKKVTETYLPKTVKKFTETYLPKLAENITELQAFYDKYSQSYLAKTTKYALPKKTEEYIDQLSDYFETKEHNELDKKSQIQIRIQEGYVVPDQQALLNALKQIGLIEYTAYDIVKDPSASSRLSSADDFDELIEYFKLLVDLATKCGIDVTKFDDDPVFQAGDTAIYRLHIAFRDIVNAVLAVIVVDLADGKPITKEKAIDTRTVVNIKHPDQHRYIGRPSTTSFLDMVEGAVAGKELKKLAETYRTKEEREEKGGFLAHIENPQVALPFIYDETDATTKIKLMANFVALTVDAVTALQAYKRDNPNNTGYIKLRDLAQYIKRYADDIEVKGSLRPQYRQALLNGLTIAQFMGADYIIDKNKKTGYTRWHRVYLINRITDFETNKKGETIAIKTDFTDEYKASLSYNLGVVLDGTQNLKDTESKMLAVYISDRQVAKQGDTVEGKQISFNAKTLCDKAGIIDKTVTNRYRTLAKMLNELEENQVAVGGWETKSGGKNISTRDQNSLTILIKPPKHIQEAYVTRRHSKAFKEGERVEQQARLSKLKRYARGYTDRNILADEIGVTRPELDELLAGQEPITDMVLNKLDLDVLG